VTPLIASLAVLLLAASGGLIAAFVLWRPASALVYRRADAVMRGAQPAHLSRAQTAAPNAALSLLVRFFTLGMPRTWGVHTAVPALLLLGLVAAIAAWLASNYILDLPKEAGLALVFIALWSTPHVLARIEQGKADKRFIDIFPDAIDMIVRMLRAGLPVSQAIRTVAEKEPAPINAIFGAVADQIAIGIPLDEAFSISSASVGLPDFRFFAAAVALQHTTGGNLVSTLEILADIVRKRRAVRMKARAATSEVRTSAYVLAGLPLIVIAALGVMNPSYMAVLITEPRGNFILMLVGLLLLMAFFSMRYLMRRVTRI